MKKLIKIIFYKYKNAIIIVIINCKTDFLLKSLFFNKLIKRNLLILLKNLIFFFIKNYIKYKKKIKTLKKINEKIKIIKICFIKTLNKINYYNHDEKKFVLIIYNSKKNKIKNLLLHIISKKPKFINIKSIDFNFIKKNIKKIFFIYKNYIKNYFIKFFINKNILKLIKKKSLINQNYIKNKKIKINNYLKIKKIKIRKFLIFKL